MDSKNCEQKKLFHIWLEGYVATGESSKAQLLGSIEAVSFREACEELSKKTMVGYWSKEFDYVWGCKVYDSERDARKNFG